jgi:hypothetical protein
MGVKLNDLETKRDLKVATLFHLPKQHVMLLLYMPFSLSYTASR